MSSYSAVCGLRPLRVSLLRFSGPARTRPFRHAFAVRPIATGRGKDDKTWGDIADEAVTLGKNVAGKVTSGAKGLLGKILPSARRDGSASSSASASSSVDARIVDQRQEQGEELYRRGSEVGRELFGGGLVGRAMGGLVGRALRNVGEAVADASRRVADVRERAADAIERDSRVTSALGGSCTTGAPISQSSMSQSINGRSSQRVTLVLPVQGANGRLAQAQVDYTESQDKVDDLSVAVRLPDGSVVRIGGGGTGGGGRASVGETIDVEWKALD